MSGKVGMSIDYQDGKVIVEFDRAVKHIKLTPEQAGYFSRVIIDKAMGAAGQPKGSSGIIIPSILN